MIDLQLDVDMAWEVGEHRLLDNILSTVGFEEDVNIKKCFSFDEERKEHSRLEMMITNLSIADDEHVPTQEGTSG